MNIVVQHLLPYVLTYKYIAIYIITFTGAILLPIPSGTIIMAAAAFAVQGYLNFPLVITMGIIGNISGDHAGYWIAKKYGVPTLRKIGFRKTVDSPGFLAAQDNINRHPFFTIFLSRFMTAVAPTVNIVVGLSSIKYRHYSIYEILGEVCEVSIYGGIGYLFGSHWQEIDQLLGKFWILILASILFSFYLTKSIMTPRPAKK